MKSINNNNTITSNTICDIDVTEIKAAMAAIEAGDFSGFTEVEMESPVVEKKKRNRVHMTKLPSRKMVNVCDSVDFSKVVTPTEKREVVDVTHTIGKGKIKKTTKKVVVNENWRGNTSKKFGTKMSQLFSREEIVTSLKERVGYKVTYLNLPLDEKRIESLGKRLGKAIASLKKEVVTSKAKVARKITPQTQKKGVATPKRPVVIQRVVRLEIGHRNWGLLLGRSINRRVEVMVPLAKTSMMKERISDFLNYGDPITIKGSKIRLTFCKNGIEVVGHAPKQIVMFDGKKSRYSYECEFISEFVAMLKVLGYRINKVGDKVTVAINEVEGMYQWVKDTAIELVKKTTNIIVSTADRAINVVAGEVTVGVQMCSIESVKICTNDSLINKINWTPCLYINGELAIEVNNETEDLRHAYMWANNSKELGFKYDKVIVNEVEYETINLNELNNVTHYYNYFDALLLLKRGNIVFVAHEKGSKWRDDVNVKKLVYASDFDYYQSSIRALAYEDKLADTDYYATYECIKILVECHFDDVYDVIEGTWNDWSIYESALEIMNKANLTNKQMIEILKELSFQRNNPLTSLLFVYLTAEIPEADVIGEIFGAVNRQYIYENYGVCVLNSIVPMGEVRGDVAWQEAFGIMMDVWDNDCDDDLDTDDELTEWDDIDYSGGYDCSDAISWARQYQMDNMYYGFEGTVLVHCTSDQNVEKVNGEVCGSIWSKGHTYSFKDSGFIFAPIKDCVSVVFNQDVWSKTHDWGHRTLSNCKYIREKDICINVKDATIQTYYNEAWIVPSKTRIVAGFYNESCEKSYIWNIELMCRNLNVPCFKLMDYIHEGHSSNYCYAYNQMVDNHNWNILSQFAFKSDNKSYDHIIEENKELEYVDKYEYIDMQMCGAIDIHVTTNNMECFVDGYVNGHRIFGKANCVGLKKGPSCSLFTSSPKHTELRGLVIGAEEAVRLGYKELTFVNVSKKTIKLLKYGCPAIEGDIFRAMFKKLTEKLNVNFVNRKVNTVEEINLQLFADNNTGSSVPETNGSEKEVQNNVQKETSSHKEGVNKMTTNINTSNNNTNKVDCQTSIWHGYDNQDYLVPGIVVLEAVKDYRGKLVYRKDHELSPLEVKQMLLNYFRNVPEVNKKSVETEFISHIFTTANSLNYFDAMAKPYEVKLVTVPTTNLKDNNYIIEAAMKDVNKNCLEDIFKAQLIIGSESALAKLKGCKVETYGELLSSMIERDPQNKTMSFVDISSAAKVVARLKSPRNCNEVISKGRHGDKQARVLIVPNSQQAGYTWLDEKFAQDFKLEVTKKYKMTGSDVIFFTENGPVSAAEALDNYKQMGGDLFKGTTAHWNDAIAVIDGREFQNDWDWSVKPEIKRISSRVSKRNGAERIEYSVTIWLKGYTHPVSGCKLRGVVSAKNLMVKGKMTDFSDAIGLKSVVLVGEKIQVAVQGRDGMVKYDAIIPTEAIKFPTFIKNHMGSTFNYVMAEVWDYEENAMVWKECVEGVMELGFESPTGEGRGSYKRIHEKFVQAYGFVQATKGLKGIVPDDVIDGVVSWYEDSIKKNMSTGISLIKGIRGESNVEYKEISLDDFCKLTDGDIIGNETGYCIKSLGGNSELVKPICIPKGKLIYRFFTYCPSDVENFGKDDIVAQMTKAEDPNSIREMKGGLRQLINTLRDINADKSLPLVNEIEEARQRMVADAVEHTKDFFSASFDGGCFTVIYADWLKGDVCGLENSKHKYCSIGRQPYTNFWLNFVEVQDMETISKHSPFKISSRFSKNVVVLPFSKANPTHGDSDGDFAIIKFINDIIAKRWIESGVNSRLEKAFASQFGDPSQRKLNNLLKKVDIRKFFETKTYTYSYDELAHFFAMACQSKANTQTTTSLAYAMGIILGETIAEVNTARNEDSRLQRHIAFNGAFFKLVQDAIDGIKANASTIEIDSIRKIVVAFMQDARNMNMFFGLCNDYKVSAVTTEHQVECINKARGRILSTGHNAEKVYKAIRDIVRITSGKMDYNSMVAYKEGFDKSFNSVNPGVFNKVERFLNAIITKEPTATNYHIALSAKEELNAMGITNEMLQAGNPEAISDKERAKGATYSWISQHISKYANSEAMSCLAWEDKPKEIAKYVCSTEFEKTYEDYNEEGEKVMSRIGRLASLAITIIGGKVSANTGVSGKLFSKLQANASGDKAQDAKFNRTETRRVIGLICLAIALNKGQLRNKDFWYSIGSRLLVNVNGFAALRSIAEKKFAETSKKIQDANQPEAKTITIEDAIAIASTIVTADNGIDLQLFASNPVRSNSKSSKTATTKRERITLKKATRGVVLSELAKLNRHSIERGRGPLPVEVQSWFLEHRMGFDWSVGKCSTREDVHCSYLCKETSTCYYCMIYKHNNCNQIYPATIFPITGEKDYYLAKNTQGYSIINFIK